MATAALIYMMLCDADQVGLHAAQAIRTLTEKFRYVVLDCPPILSFADAIRKSIGSS